MSLAPETILCNIPAGLRNPLLETYREIAANYSEQRWEPSELNGGKFCEVVYTILDGAISGSYATAPSKPANMKAACLGLEQRPAKSSPGDRSLRVLIPRTLLPLYEIRNNRGVGHVGGDVNPNLMDATTVYTVASWIFAELIRIFHSISTAEAQDAVDALIERNIPLIWAPTDNIKRVLDTEMSSSDKILLLLHQQSGWTDDAVLVGWIEYSNASVYRNKILTVLHSQRLIEYDKQGRRARISPKGSASVVERILKPRIVNP